MTVPVAEMTYFDSIGNLTVLSLPPSTVMDRSTEEGVIRWMGIFVKKKKVRNVKSLSRLRPSGDLESERAPSAG